MNQFAIKICCPEPEFEILLEGRFEEASGSVYAHYTPMNLVAGAHIRKNSDSAKLKAILRLVVMFELKLDAHKRAQNYSTLFMEDIDSKLKDLIIKYAENSSFGAMFSSSSKNRIPVMTEDIQIERNTAEFRIEEKGSVKNMAQLQLSHIKNRPHQHIRSRPRTINIQRQPSETYIYAHT